MTPEMMKNQTAGHPSTLKEGEYDSKGRRLPKKLRDQYETEEDSPEQSEDDFAYLGKPRRVEIDPLTNIEEIYRSGKMSKRPNSHIRNLSFSGDSKFLLVNCFTDELKLMGTKDRQIRASIDDHHKSTVLCAKFSPNNKFFFSAGKDNRVIIWDALTFKRHSVYNMTETYLKDSHKGKRLLDKRQVEATEIQNIFDASWSPDGESIIVAGIFHLYQIIVREKEKEILLEDVFETGELKCIDYSPDGEKVICATTLDFKVIAFDREDSLIFRKDRPHTYFNLKNQESVDSILYVSWTRCGRFVLTCAENSNIFWHAVKGTKVYSISGNYRINVVDYSWNGKLMIAGCRDRSIRVFDMENLRYSFEISEAHKYQIWSISFSPEGWYCSTGDVGGIVKFWELKGEKSFPAERPEIEDRKIPVHPSLPGAGASTKIVPSGFNTPRQETSHGTGTEERLSTGKEETIDFNGLPGDNHREIPPTGRTAQIPRKMPTIDSTDI
jgi:WD40 repeat protein